jgi:DNA modification methylase
VNPVTLKPGIGDSRPTATLYYGQDVRETLRTLPEASVHTVCTSPPYFGLRDYGKDGQIGLEPTPDEFVAALVEVFREVKRVLRPDGTLWVNLGDSYAGGGGYSPNSPSNIAGSKQSSSKGSIKSAVGVPQGLKPKDLVGIPWRVAFALQADGWYLRQDIIWSKGSCMPEGVTDRCTKSHEYVFLLSHPDSGGKYFYDFDAVKEPVAVVQPPRRFGRKEYEQAQSEHGYRGAREVALSTGQGTDTSAGNHYGRVFGGHETRNKRSVWNVNPRPYSGAHFAVWPPDLVRPMVRAGCPVGGTVLDPFSGSGTTGMVALQEGRNYVGIDLNEDYLNLAVNRVQEHPAPQPDAPVEEGSTVFDLFGDAG